MSPNLLRSRSLSGFKAMIVDAMICRILPEQGVFCIFSYTKWAHSSEDPIFLRNEVHLSGKKSETAGLSEKAMLVCSSTAQYHILTGNLFR
ncbi:MAG: hypothetical protein A3F09_04840 [Chlamydiae bacterium RIFCSPHIGHO2_12_FULL_49_11]|nr:MAG: hypothetical protein A3F09_04840 [Chlamydiae bacterium RIFCSPHIGHO2_12_FULL_49_11]